uniref:Cytochrome c biogenesis protein CcsA n=1 Tax=Zygnema circumcarinatum TaxID=35869 RepID=A0A6N0GXB4_ZYGCR|nr:protein involved in cytochrome c biogenesis [Zygnema circumcarinatum]
MLMNFLILEQMGSNLCLITLCITTLVYWMKIVWSNMMYLSLLAKLGMRFSNVLLAMLLVERWFSSGHIPFSNLYESFVLLTWNITFLHVLLEKKIQNEWLGAIIAPSALFMQAFATIALPGNLKHSMFLVPALQSNWLVMHVSMMILSYGALLFGSLLAVTLLIVNLKSIKIDTQSLRTDSMVPWNMQEDWFFDIRRMYLVDQLDYWSYRALGIGFILLTIGIISGAVWANEAWGSYWNWDPKETWALITWLVFAIYLHTRMGRGWNGQKSALVATFGLCLVWTCYLGVNLLGKGLHTYGWFQ